ncbi:hypothetical protein DVH24_011876 [Malus domestica]|uniref:Uncharacterized protein n=1 Tax=Malus domestica TaxID=3750 RepID=A0A498JGP8_MALDO|nr:hypothetical protein DVH24_011876 [Malus domestica]
MKPNAPTRSGCTANRGPLLKLAGPGVDYLRQDFPLGIGLVDDLEVEEEELLEGVVLGREDVADDEVRDGVAIEEEQDGQ